MTDAERVEQLKEDIAAVGESKNEDEHLGNILEMEEYLNRKNVGFLEYEKQMFLDMLHADALLVAAKGINCDRVISSLLQVYCDPGNLILVINCSDYEEQHYKSLLDSKYIKPVANTSAERELNYLEGGIQFITTRIFVVDLLKKRIPIELITGIVVLRAHSIIESCQEAFALRLYRQSNKTGFVKAFSSNVEAFTFGYGHAERVMRNLFARSLFIWPRFHSTIQQSLKPYEPHVTELHIPMTAKMIAIQTKILDIMNFTVKEIKRINRFVDLQEITVENCVTKRFHKILQAQLDPIWHQLSAHTKLLIADLKLLRSLMIAMIYGDSVSFYAHLKRYRSTEYAMNNSGWLLLDATEQMFAATRSRVYSNAEGDLFNPEPSPKWKVLSEIIRVEIPADIKRSPKIIGPNELPKVLILCQDPRTCYQLQQYLVYGCERFFYNNAVRREVSVAKLGDAYKKMLGLTVQNSEVVRPDTTPADGGCKSIRAQINARRKEKKPEEVESADPSLKDDQILDDLKELVQKEVEQENFRDTYMLTMSQRVDVSGVSNESDLDVSRFETGDFEEFIEMESLDITGVINGAQATVAAASCPLIQIQAFKTEKDGFLSLTKTLEEMRPQYVIMYNNSVMAIRQLEVYEARQMRQKPQRTRVFFLLYRETVEEQSYLTSLRREKQAFEHLIETKRGMVILENQDGKASDPIELINASQEKPTSTRQAGGQEDVIAKEMRTLRKIVVDMREFRSDLPCLIHKRGIDVVPVTITIGDYILTPEICVERKSISDLIGSLNSGRLYNQCIQMTRFYAKPILLIEFEQNKPFHLQGHYMLSKESSSNSDIVQKLQLLTIYFPKLRLVWSPSPYATAQLFEELKEGKLEPDAGNAATIGSDEAGPDFEQIAEKYNSNIHDFMVRLPGVNSKNIAKVMRDGGCLKDLIKKSKAELSELLGSDANAEMFWEIVHVAHKPVEEGSIRNSASRGVGAGSMSAGPSGFGRGGKRGWSNGRGRRP